MPATRILVAVHSSRGQTEKIGRYVADRLNERGAVTDVHPVESAPPPGGYDVVVLGDSIHLSRHSRELIGYLQQYSAQLAGIPAALFQVSMTSIHTDPEHAAQAQSLVRQLLDETGFAPDAVGVFAGALAYTSYGWATKKLVRGIAKKSGLDTDTARDHEYTDWAAVDRFADDVYALTVYTDIEPLRGGDALSA